MTGRLLVVHHTPSPATQALLEAALDGASDDALAGLDVVTRPALSAGPSDVLAADAVLLGTPANIGYMSGALKHFFEETYRSGVLFIEGPNRSESANRPPRRRREV